MNETKWFGSGEVAKTLGIPRWRLMQLIELGKLPDASCQVTGRRLFSAGDVERVVARFHELNGKPAVSEAEACEPEHVGA